MKQQRKDAIGVMVASIVWIVVAVILFLLNAHYRSAEFLDGILGEGVLGGLIKIPVSLLWVLIYSAGFLGLFSGGKQFITAQKSPTTTETQQDQAKNAEQRAPVDADKPRRC